VPYAVVNNDTGIHIRVIETGVAVLELHQQAVELVIQQAGGFGKQFLQPGLCRLALGNIGTGYEQCDWLYS